MKQISDNVYLAKATNVKRVYDELDVSALTISEVEEYVEKDIEYAVDYGFEIGPCVQFKISRN